MKTIQNTVISHDLILDPIARNNLDIHNAFRKLPVGIYGGRDAVLGANTYITAPDFLQPEAVTQIVDAFAPVRAFATVFDPNPYSPKVSNHIKFVTASAATQQNPSTFQGGADTISDVQVPVTHFSQQWQVSNTDYNSGLRIEDGFMENMLTLSQTVTANLAAKFKAANFPATPVQCDPATFGLDYAAQLFTGVKKSNKRSLILDGDYYARLAHVAGFTGLKAYGWDGIYPQSASWSSAGARVRGIACGPSAILIVTGFLHPLIAPNIKQRIVGLGDLGITVEYNTTFDTATRSYCASLDLVFGSAACDGTAAVLLLNN
jgi:hypothetical protein